MRSALWTTPLLRGWLHAAAVPFALGAVAAPGAGLSGLLIRLPRWMSVALYLALGWFAVVAAPRLVAGAPRDALLLMLAGSVCSSLGAVVSGRRWPTPLPRHFGSHEVFHLFGVLGGAAFLAAIWQVTTGSAL